VHIQPALVKTRLHVEVKDSHGRAGAGGQQTAPKDS
jgi:hypothetical protein